MTYLMGPDGLLQFLIHHLAAALCGGTTHEEHDPHRTVAHRKQRMRDARRHLHHSVPASRSGRSGTYEFLVSVVLPR